MSNEDAIKKMTDLIKKRDAFVEISRRFKKTCW